MVRRRRRRRPGCARLIECAGIHQRDEGPALEVDQGRHALRVRAMNDVLALMIPLAVFAMAAVHRGGAPLRVCADPNNLPFSNQQQQGFENHIASLIGEELHRPVEYTWWAQRRGFVRNTLNAKSCDLVVGTVSGMEMLVTTRPYYKSTYVFVSRR